tara:strand:+ start:116 stop:295 length:180 start_codon:yes stop_codon:yes gene_type:complete
MNHSIDKSDNTKPECSHCNDSGVVYIYNKDGDAVHAPCPKCTEDVISHIRTWGGQMFDG